MRAGRSLIISLNFDFQQFSCWGLLHNYFRHIERDVDCWQSSACRVKFELHCDISDQRTTPPCTRIVADRGVTCIQCEILDLIETVLRHLTVPTSSKCHVSTSCSSAAQKTWLLANGNEVDRPFIIADVWLIHCAECRVYCSEWKCLGRDADLAKHKTPVSLSRRVCGQTDMT